MEKVRQRVEETRVLPGGKSGLADHVEQKMVAKMYQAGVDHAEVVINHSGGPCPDPRLGCQAVLDQLLGNKTLTVHWRDAMGEMQKWTYGGI